MRNIMQIFCNIAIFKTYLPLGLLYGPLRCLRLSHDKFLHLRNRFTHWCESNALNIELWTGGSDEIYRDTLSPYCRVCELICRLKVLRWHSCRTPHISDWHINRHTITWVPFDAIPNRVFCGSVYKNKKYPYLRLVITYRGFRKQFAQLVSRRYKTETKAQSSPLFYITHKDQYWKHKLRNRPIARNMHDYLGTNFDFVGEGRFISQ